MLIPSIDLQDGAVVQLVQGERLAIRDEDVFAWVRKFERFPKVQVIDLDAAMGRGDNLHIVRRIAGSLSCRVGGGVRSVERAQDILAAGANAVIVGSSLFNDGRPDLTFAKRMADAIGVDRVIAAVDSKGGHVVIHGWKTELPITAAEAVRALEPYCAEFLYTHVDKEGLMGGTDLNAILALRRETTRRLTAAGGITTKEEIDTLHEHDVDAVVGMALYTGRLSAKPLEWAEHGMEIRRDDLSGSEIQALLAEHLTDMHRISPRESVHALDLDGLRQPNITFWTVWLGAELLGCGALKELDARHGEIKSMRTASAHRRTGVGKTMLIHILDEAKRRGYERLSLETGAMREFEPARRLYASFGFTSCGPFADYWNDPNSAFMTKRLTEP
jgi:phosphoribosylformimino-5-aminoimidazole carboxamide ribonucleotide (ProFAR) isomerase/ribosomal protein S18 acetylase RimI-like enzyme